MLADLNEVFQVANEKKIAIGAFNVVNFEHIQAILEATEKLNMPTILAFAQTLQIDVACVVARNGAQQLVFNYCLSGKLFSPFPSAV